MSIEELKALAARGGMEVKDLINKQSQVFKRINPPINEMDENAILTLMQEYPKIMFRPLVIGSNTFLKGFKADDYASQWQ